MIRTAGRLIPGLALFLCAASAQEVTVYSEFTRIDPFGKPVRADRGAQPPREILSPAMPRGAFSSFRLVVEGQPGAKYTVDIAQNPDDAVHVTAYREKYAKLGGEWVPDALEPVKLPYDGVFGDSGAPAQTAQSFWIDMLADRQAPVRRIKVEPQVYIDDGWLRYPMEVRVTEPVLGPTPVAHVPGASDIGLPLSASALSAWAALACKTPVRNTAEPTIRSLIARNVAQDFRFAGGIPPKPLLRLAGALDRAALCRASKPPRRDSEEYLKVRDTLIGARE
ncbi:MAG: hypothetical protein JSU00_01415 [Acidobacteria bacterium]|nr:hypothetical protein [Acidobacteriota bacterium]